MAPLLLLQILKGMAFSFSNRIYIGFFSFKFEISALKLTHVQNFSQIGQKIKGSRILTMNNSEKGLITSYTPDSDDIIKAFDAFERFCAKVPSYRVWF